MCGQLLPAPQSPRGCPRSAGGNTQAGRIGPDLGELCQALLWGQWAPGVHGTKPGPSAELRGMGTEALVTPGVILTMLWEARDSDFSISSPRAPICFPKLLFP